MTYADATRRHAGTVHIDGLGRNRASANVSKITKAKINGELALPANAGGAIVNRVAEMNERHRSEQLEIYSGFDNLLTAVTLVVLLLAMIFTWAG